MKVGLKRIRCSLTYKILERIYYIIFTKQKNTNNKTFVVYNLGAKIIKQ